MPRTVPSPEKVRVPKETAIRLARIKKLRRGFRWYHAIDALLDGWEMLTDEQKQKALNGKGQT